MNTTRNHSRSILAAALIVLAGIVLAVGQIPAFQSFVAIFWLAGTAPAVGALAVAIIAFRQSRRREDSPPNR
jgi:hypothetical protein